jgi:AcrR family transcriptional regulator
MALSLSLGGPSAVTSEDVTAIVELLSPPMPIASLPDMSAKAALEADVQADSADGRHLRRARNREAVVDALLRLIDLGHLDPTIAEIAETAGLSARSVFRYFDDLDDLVRAAMDRQRERLAPLMARTVDPALPRAERVERFVAHRVELLEMMGNVGRLARRRAPVQPLVAEELQRIRGVLAHHVEVAFAPELGDGDARARRAAAIDIVTSFEAYEAYRRDHALDRSGATTAMREAVAAILDAAAGSDSDEG